MINMTITDFLKDRADRNSEDIAFRFLETGDLEGPIAEWTFSELYHKSAGVAQDLTEQGLAGSSVLLAFPPGLDFVKAFYGCLLAGIRAVPVPLPNPRSKNPLGRIINTAIACGASTVLTNKPLADMISEMVPDLPVNLRAVSDNLVTDWSGPEADMKKVAYLQFTSGSTGLPKGVAVNHGNIISNLRVMGQMLRIKSSQPAMVWAPHYHDLCLAGHVLGPVLYGFESILMSPLEFLKKPVRWLRAMSHYKVANTASPNFGYEYSVRRIKPKECEGLDLSHVSVAGNGGEPVLKKTMDAFITKFEPYGFRPQAFMPCYGMAESVLFVAGKKPLSETARVLKLSAADLETHTIRVMDDTDSGVRDVISCGAPGADHTVIAVDPVSLTPSGPDKIGELWVKGPSVPGLYWGMPDESAATFEGQLAETNEGSFLRTGDFGFVADGEVYVTGRLKDMIIIAGRNHYPSDIEMTVQKSGAPVRRGASAAISETIDGHEELVILAEVDKRKLPDNVKNESADMNAIREFWSSAVNFVKSAVTQGHGLKVRSVVFVEPKSLEKTSSGKPRRQHYKSLYLEGNLVVLHEKKQSIQAA